MDEVRDRPRLLAVPPEVEIPIEAPGPGSDGYQVRLDVFEGPLDLLLFLIRKKKIDIHDIPIAVITREYLDYLDRKEQINLDREAEFLLMAALLIYIKSQMLLPREKDRPRTRTPGGRSSTGSSSYQKVKAACSVLREREEEQLRSGSGASSRPCPGEEDLDLIEVSLFDLAESFFAMLKRHAARDFKVLKGKEISLDDKMREIVRHPRGAKATSISWNTSSARKRSRRPWSPSSASSSSSSPGSSWPSRTALPHDQGLASPGPPQDASP